MRWSAIKFSFVVSILFHGVALGLIAAVGFRLRPAELQPEAAPVTLMLIAAPMESAVAPVQPEAVSPAQPPPVEAKPPEMPALVHQVKVLLEPAELLPMPRTTALAPVPTSTAPAAERTLQPSVHGDGSSPRPGQDATTVTAQPGTRARPTYVEIPRPPYPPLALRRRQQGLVVMTVKVTAQGRAEHVEIKQATGYPLLDEAAVRAARNAEYEPGSVGGGAVGYEAEATVRFILRN